MKSDAFEKRMRRGEYFHSLRVPDEMWIVIRLDGRGFTKMTKEMECLKPFDYTLHQCMVGTVEKLMHEFQGVFATTHSDEISVLFPPQAEFFDREVEKIVSTTAAFASVTFSTLLQHFGTFDSRLWIGATTDEVIDYFLWRADDSLRGSINSYAYWLLRQRENYTKRQATRELLHKNFAWKNELLFQKFQINFNDLPVWERRGTGFYFQLIEKEGLNPLTNEKITTLRRILYTETNLPMKDAFREFLHINLTHMRYVPELRNSFPFSVGETLQKDKEEDVHASVF